MANEDFQNGFIVGLSSRGNPISENGTTEVIEQVQTDWNQNDGGAVDYIKNRPIYKEIGETEVLLEQTYGLENNGAVVEFKLDIEIGDKYDVTFIKENGAEEVKTLDVVASNSEGIEFELPKVQPSLGYHNFGENVYTLFVLANNTAVGEDGGPIIQEGCFFYGFASTEYVGVKINGTGVVYHKLEKEYLPDEILEIPTQVDDLYSAIEDLESADGALSEEIVETQNNLAILQGKITETEENLNTFKGNVYTKSEVEEKLEDLEANLPTSPNNGYSKSEVDELIEESNSSLSQEISNSAAALQENIEGNSSAINEVKESLESVNNSITSISGQVSTLESGLGDLNTHTEEELGKLNTSIEELSLKTYTKEEIDAKDTTLSNSITSSAGALQESIDNVTEKVTEIEDDLGETNQVLEALSSNTYSKDEVNSKEGALNDKIQANTAAINSLEENTYSKEAVNAKETNLQTSLNSVQTELNGKIQSNTDAITSLEENTYSKEEINTKETNLQTSINNIATSLNSAQTELNGKIQANTTQISTISSSLEAHKTLSEERFTELEQQIESGGSGSSADATAKVSAHNESAEAHKDIRKLISDIQTLLGSNDEDLDTLQEIVNYIKSNKTLIDSITTTKINVDAIVNDLTTGGAANVLSAEQGKVLKGLINSLETALTTKIDAKADATATTKSLSDINTKLDGVSDALASHDHDDRYLGKEESALKAWRLQNTRTLQTNLDSTLAANFDGSENASIGVAGTLPIAHGGTGGNTAYLAREALGITPENIGADDRGAAAQAYADAIAYADDIVPTKTSQLINDSGFKTTDTTYSTATQSANGLMSAADKTKLDGIATGANKTTVDSALSSSSTNPVQNKVVNTALGNKVDKVTGKGLSTNDYTTTEKNKLAGIASGANAYTHPTTSGNKHIPSGGSSGQILRWSADGTAVWGADNNTTYSAATQSANGLMSAADKKKLDGIATGANAYSHPTTSGNKHIPSGGSSGQILRWSADGTAAWGSDKVPIVDTRNTNQTPEWYWTYYPRQVVREFKSISALGIYSGETYCCLETIVPWADASGGYPKQIVTTDGAQWIRIGTSATTWSTWSFVFNAYNDIGLAPGKAIDLYHESRGKVRAVDMTEGGYLRFGVGTHPTSGGNSVTELVGGEINFWTKHNTSTGLKPYYAAGDSFVINGVTTGMIQEDAYTIELSLPLSKPIIGSPTISVTVLYGISVKQNGKMLYGSVPNVWNTSISKITPLKLDDNCIHLGITMSNATNVTTRCECGVGYHLYVTLS